MSTHQGTRGGAGVPTGTLMGERGPLSELAAGGTATIVSVDDSMAIGRRLLDLGLLPGTAIRALRVAPLGDPGIFELRGYRLCLRKSESSRVQIETQTADPEAEGG